MQQILDLLKKIDAENSKDVITSIRFYSDGSGIIYQGDLTEIVRFDNLPEAVIELQRVLKNI